MDMTRNKLFFALATICTLPACSWVDSTGRSSNSAPKIQIEAPQIDTTDIQFDDEVASIEERKTLRVSVVDDTTVSAIFRRLNSGKAAAAACSEWFSSDDAADSLEDACVSADNCSISFDTDDVSSSNYLLTAPAINKPVALQYEILAEDVDGATDSHVLDLCIRTINDAPETQSDTYIVQYQQALTIPGVEFDQQCLVSGGQGVLDNDEDDRDYKGAVATTGKCMTANLLSPPNAHSGGFNLSETGGFSYASDGTLAPGETDSFSYFADDGDQQSRETQVQILIQGKNSAPVALANTSFEVTNGNRLTLSADQLADDPEGFALSIVEFTNANHGETGLDEGSAYYQPEFAFNGSDNFNVTVSDPAGEKTVVLVTLEVSASNLEPEIIGLTDIEENYSGSPSTVDSFAVPFRVTDIETDNQILQVAVESSASTVVSVQRVGSLNGSGRGEFILQPLSNGEATITLSVTDEPLNSVAANTVSESFKVSISGMREPGENNHKPRAENDYFTIQSLQTRRFDVSSNDTDADGDVLSYRITDTGELGNQASISTDGQLTIQAPLVFRRSIYWVEYEVDDGYGGVDTANARIRVNFF